MRFQLAIFSKELILFSATLILGLWAAYQYLGVSESSLFVQASGFHLYDLWSLAIVVLILLLAMKFRSVGRFFFRAFLLLLVFAGAVFISGLLFNWPYDLLGALLLLAAFLLWRNVLIHNVAIIITLAGIGALLGISITPTLGIGLLVVLSFYDIIAVYKTKHMIRMAQGMIESGAIFGFIIPNNFRSFMTHRRQAQSQIGTQFMILGSGDIGLPVIFASSLVRQSLSQAIIVAIFAVIGLLATHILFVSQAKRKPMEGLPPISTMRVIGYLRS